MPFGKGCALPWLGGRGGGSRPILKKKMQNTPHTKLPENCSNFEYLLNAKELKSFPRVWEETNTLNQIPSNLGKANLIIIFFEIHFDFRPIYGFCMAYMSSLLRSGNWGKTQLFFSTCLMSNSGCTAVALHKRSISDPSLSNVKMIGCLHMWIDKKKEVNFTTFHRSVYLFWNSSK